MKKLKVVSSLALVGLSSLTLAACGDSEETQTSTDPVDVETEKNEAVLEYAKTDAIHDLTVFQTNTILLLGVKSDSEVALLIKGYVNEAASKINEATTSMKIDVICDSCYGDIKSAVDSYASSTKTALAEAVVSAKNELDEVAINGFYMNTKDDGSVEALRVYSASMFDKAANVSDLTVMFNEAKTIIENQFEIILENSYVKISTIEEFKAMETGKNYKLANDLDFVDVVDTAGSLVAFSGIFDGGGHTIKNYNIEAIANKRGLLFQSMAEGSVVKNVRFMNCSHVGDQEGIALITGEATKAVFSNIEFYGCTVDAGSKSYAGLLIGRKTIKGVTVDQITVKGNSKTSANYGGGLIGDARDLGDDAVVSFTNLDINMDMNVVGNTGGLLIGRLDGDKAKFIVENARIHANITGSSSKTSLLFDGATDHTDYTVKNVLLSATYGKGITSDMFVGNKYGPTTAENIYYNKDTTEAVLKSDVPVAVESKDLTAAWYFDTLGLDKSVWMEEADGSVKLKGASSNVIEEGAELLSIEVLSSRAKTYFYFDDAFDSTNLVVVGSYKNSDGSVLQASLSETAVGNLGSYSVNTDSFNNKAAGTYTIAVTASKNNPADTNPDDGQDKWEVTGNYVVTVNTISELDLYAQEANVIFLKGEEFDITGLVVKALYSNDATTTDDDKLSTIHNSESKQFFTVDSSAFNKDSVGSYTITVTASENNVDFTKTYTVEVVDKIDITGLTSIAVSVDPTATQTVVDLTNKTATFNTIAKALDYLGSLGLADSVKKTINLADGSYEEKITVNIPNVSFIGTSEEGTIITYGAAAGHTYLDESLGNYGTDSSATVLVKAAGFSAKNITFVNSFDYDSVGVSDKQALAIGVYADNAVFFNCSFKGCQDTLQTKYGRSYFYECYIEGFTDFIFGVDCTAYFEKCEIKSLNRNSSTNGGYVVAPKTAEAYTYGFYFNDCDFTAAEGVTNGTVSIARPWGATGTCVVINSRLGSHISKDAFLSANSVNCRYEEMSGNNPANAHFKEYGNTGEGAITEAVTGMTMLTETEAQALTLANLFKVDTALGFEAWDAAAALAALRG